jgi:hypothetical protein
MVGGDETVITMVSVCVYVGLVQFDEGEGTGGRGGGGEEYSQHVALHAGKMLVQFFSAIRT